MEDQLLRSLDALVPVSLTESAIDRLEEQGGVYQLFLDDSPVYVGKADKSLRVRLQKHFRKLSGRKSDSDIPLNNRVQFKCLYVLEDLNALAPEKMLIKHFQPTGKATWNVNGFGNNDPGKNRDRSTVKAGHFDREYPVDTEVLISLDVTQYRKPINTAFDLMSAVKQSLPYLLRFPTQSPDNRPLKQTPLDADLKLDQTASAQDWLEIMASQLPHDWLITVLPGYIICYRETDPSVYQSRLGSWEGGSKTPQYIPHAPTFDSTGSSEIAEDSVSDESLDERQH